jgi:hypothetical protein
VLPLFVKYGEAFFDQFHTGDQPFWIELLTSQKWHTSMAAYPHFRLISGPSPSGQLLPSKGAEITYFIVARSRLKGPSTDVSKLDGHIFLGRDKRTKFFKH